MTHANAYNAQYAADRRAEQDRAAAERRGIKLTAAEIKLLHMPVREVRLPRLAFLERRFAWERGAK
jgi:hypothetical protein